MKQYSHYHYITFCFSLFFFRVWRYSYRIGLVITHSNFMNNKPMSSDCERKSKMPFRKLPQPATVFKLQTFFFVVRDFLWAGSGGIYSMIVEARGRIARGWKHDCRSMLIIFEGNWQFSHCLDGELCKIECPNFNVCIPANTKGWQRLIGER